LRSAPASAPTRCTAWRRARSSSISSATISRCVAVEVALRRPYPRRVCGRARSDRQRAVRESDNFTVALTCPTQLNRPRDSRRPMARNAKPVCQRSRQTGCL
jgi:hypothetical protein